MEALETRLTKRMAYSIESLGEIIKEYAKKQKSLSDKLKHLDAPKKRGASSNQHVAVKGPSNAKASNAKRQKDPSVGRKAAQKQMEASKISNVQKNSLKNSFETKLSQHQFSQHDYPGNFNQEMHQTQDSISQKIENLQSGIWQEAQKQETGKFTNEQLMGSQNQESLNNSPSPRSAFQRVRDKSLKELGESFISAQAHEMSGKSGALIQS